MFLFILSINKIFIATSVFYFTCFLPRLFAPAHTRYPSINNWKQIYDVEFRYLCFFCFVLRNLKHQRKHKMEIIFPLYLFQYLLLFPLLSFGIIKTFRNCRSNFCSVDLFSVRSFSIWSAQFLSHEKFYLWLSHISPSLVFCHQASVVAITEIRRESCICYACDAFKSTTFQVRCIDGIRSSRNSIVISSQFSMRIIFGIFMKRPSHWSKRKFLL